VSTSDDSGTGPGTEDPRDLSGGAGTGDGLGEPRAIHTTGATEPEAPGGPEEPDVPLENPPPLA
jgi:hypothetical protein